MCLQLFLFVALIHSSDTAAALFWVGITPKTRCYVINLGRYLTEMFSGELLRAGKNIRHPTLPSSYLSSWR